MVSPETTGNEVTPGVLIGCPSKTNSLALVTVARFSDNAEKLKADKKVANTHKRFIIGVVSLFPRY